MCEQQPYIISIQCPEGSNTPCCQTYCPPACQPCQPMCPPVCQPMCPPVCQPTCQPICQSPCQIACAPCCPQTRPFNIVEPPCPDLKPCRSRELRASALITKCECVLLNGLQTDCPRKECRNCQNPTKPCCQPACCPSKYEGRYRQTTMGMKAVRTDPPPPRDLCCERKPCERCGPCCVPPHLLNQSGNCKQ